MAAKNLSFSANFTYNAPPGVNVPVGISITCPYDGVAASRIDFAISDPTDPHPVSFESIASPTFVCIKNNMGQDVAVTLGAGTFPVAANSAILIACSALADADPLDTISIALLETALAAGSVETIILGT